MGVSLRMMLYIRLALLLLSILGYCFFIEKNYGVRFEFGPAVVCSGISSIMFFAGILNIFAPVVFLLTTGGVVLLLFTLTKKRAELLCNTRSIIVCLIWIAALFYFAFLVSNAHFLHYDNFSHWATVVKSMLLNDRMPNFQDSLIMFQSYPLGSSVFIYYVCKVIGDTDACLIFGQLLMLISYLLPLIAFVKKRIAWAGIIVLLFTVTALTCNISIYDLLVDTLMPLAALALFCIIEYELGEGNKTNVVRAIWLTAPISIFLMQVKNSGIFFCIVAWVYFIVKLNYTQLSKKECSRFTSYFAGMGIFLPLVTVFLWGRHVDLVYSAGDASKHAMSIENYEVILGEKTLEDIKSIASQIIARLFDIHDVSFIIMVIITVMLLVLILFSIHAKDKKSAVNLVRKLGFIYLIFALYVISVFAMYVFSMPIGEALVLASYDRYMLSMDIFCLGIAVSYALSTENVQHEKFIVPILIGCMALTILPFKGNLSTLIKKQDYTSTIRYSFQQLIHDVPPEGSYLLYCSGENAGYTYFLSRYELWSVNISLETADNLDDCLKNISAYNYVIIATADENSQQCLRDAGLEEYATGQQCVINTASLTQ